MPTADLTLTLAFRLLSPGALNKYEFNPYLDRDCFDCTYTNQAPDGKKVKIVFEDMIDIVDNNYKCSDPWYGRDESIKSCPSNRCMVSTMNV
jgi:hypothetical protein